MAASTWNKAAPVVVVEAGPVKITECFGRVASKDDACSLAMVTVSSKSEAVFQSPQFEEYVLCTRGVLEVKSGTPGAELTTRVEAGKGVFLPRGMRSKLVWPEEAGADYTAICLPAFSPEIACPEDPANPPAVLASLIPQMFDAVDVVSAPAITITERFGHVSSKSGVCSVATAEVREAAEEAYQAPGFDEYVVCTEGCVRLMSEEGTMDLRAGEGAFLAKHFRVKWVWPEPTKYTVVCLPAFSPELSGREEDASGTVAKDSASMKRLEELHVEAAASPLAGA